ncbi:MAG: DUF4238 domain-containing protein [Firmicutes bacterium]|nr:DUF4238 domain-containing protein [Bacillota bacterium]
MPELANNRFIPKFILNNFSIERKSGTSQENLIWKYNIEDNDCNLISSSKAYGQNSLGWNENDKETSFLANSLNQSLEQEFLPVYEHKFRKTEDSITLNCDELNEVRRFLLSFLIRKPVGNFSIDDIYFYEQQYLGLTNHERKFKDVSKYSEKDRITEDIKIIITTKFENIPKHPNCSYLLFHYWYLLNSAYLGFWKTSKKVDFVLPDVYSVSERDKLKAYDFSTGKVPMYTKAGFLYKLVEEKISLAKRNDVIFNGLFQSYREANIFHENFWMFPLLQDFMIVLIHPLFKKLNENSILFERKNQFINPSRVPIKYFMPYEVNVNSDTFDDYFDKKDSYTYNIFELDDETAMYLNVLALDQAEVFFGFNDKAKIFKSVQEYQAFPSYKLNNYSNLFNTLSEGR